MRTTSRIQVRVAGPRDVWAWGTGYNVDAGQQWKELRRWDGSTWHEVAVPTPPDRFAIAASDDVWTVAETEPRAHHWDGKRWRAFELPNLGRPCLDRMHAVATKTWNAVDPPPSRPESVGAISSDGAGGLWVTESRSIGPTKLLHRDKAGRWTTHGDPTGDSTVEDITLVPGTRTLWAVGGQDYSGYPPPGAPLLMRYDAS